MKGVGKSEEKDTFRRTVGRNEVIWGRIQTEIKTGKIKSGRIKTR